MKIQLVIGTMYSPRYRISLFLHRAGTNFALIHVSKNHASLFVDFEGHREEPEKPQSASG